MNRVKELKIKNFDGVFNKDSRQDNNFLRNNKFRQQ